MVMSGCDAAVKTEAPAGAASATEDSHAEGEDHDHAEGGDEE